MRKNPGFVPAKILAGLLFCATANGAEFEFPETYNSMLNAGTLVTGGDGAYGWDQSGAFWYQGADGVHRVDPDSGKTLATKTEMNLDQVLGEQPAEGSYQRRLVMYPGALPQPDVVSPSGKQFATVIENDLAVRRPGQSDPILLTNNGSDKFGWDLLSRRMEVGNLRAAQVSPWSPDEKLLFAMKIDRSQMPIMSVAYPLADPLPSTIEQEVFSAGGPYWVYYPALVAANGSGTKMITNVDVSADFVMFLDWSSDSRSAWFAAVSRDFGQIRLFSVDADSGEARLIYTETADRGLRSPHQLYYSGHLGFNLLPGDRGFIWQSQRDGWNHLYHYDVDGTLVRQITQGNYPVDFVEHYDERSGQLYFSARSDSSWLYDVHLWRVSLEEGSAEQLTSGRGVHRVRFSPDMAYFVDQYSSPTQPPQTVIRHLHGGQKPVIVDIADISALKKTGWQPPIEFSVKSGDGITDVHGVMFVPTNFDPALRYPVLEDVYGGFFAIKADKSFPVQKPPFTNHAMANAELGYLVVRFDTPGVIGRSREFEQAVKYKWGPGVVADHATVIRNLGKEYSFVDTSRVGIYGHSWGGYNAIMALALEDDLYDAAFGSAPGASIPESADAFMEAYLGAPVDNPKAWARADLFNHLNKIEKPLMLGVGTRDSVLYTATLMISDTLIKRGFDHELVLAPKMGHGIYGPYERYFLQKSALFFAKHVPAGGR